MAQDPDGFGRGPGGSGGGGGNNRARSGERPKSAPLRRPQSAGPGGRHVVGQQQQHPVMPKQAHGSHQKLSGNEHRQDEESLRENLAQMRRSVHVLKEENKDLRGRLLKNEKDAFRKDKLLQELLDKARGGPGVSGEHLDQVREDLAVLLQYKRRAMDQKAQLEERDQTIAAIERELKVTRVTDLEEEILAAKQTAKAKARQWAERHQDTHCQATSAKYQKEARKLVQNTEQLENEVTQMVQRQAVLREEQERLTKETKENEKQISTMKRKTAELVERQQETAQKLEELRQVPEEHEALSRQCDALYEELQHLQRDEQVERRKQNLNKPQPGKFGSGEPGSGGWLVAEALFAQDFCVLPPEALNGPSHRLLWRLKHVSGRVLTEFVRCDENSDGLVTQGQLLKALKHLRISNAHKESVITLWESLHPGLKRENNQLSYLDLVFGLQRLVQPAAQFPLAELTERALPALVKSCRKARVSEAEFKGRLIGLCDPSTGPSFHHEASDLLATQLGLPAPLAEVIIDYLDLLRGDFVLHLPMWSTLDKSEASMLLETFFKAAQKADFSDRMIGLTPERFLEVLHEKLPPAAMGIYSSEELEQITLLLGEASPFAGAGIGATSGAGGAHGAQSQHHLDGERIFDAAKRGVWHEAFPDLFERRNLGLGEDDYDFDEDFDAVSDSYEQYVVSTNP